MLHQRIRRQKREDNLQFQSKNYNLHIIFKVKTKTGLHLTNINMDRRPLVQLVIKLSDLFLLLQKSIALQNTKYLKQSVPENCCHKTLKFIPSLTKIYSESLQNVNFSNKGTQELFPRNILCLFSGPFKFICH